MVLKQSQWLHWDILLEIVDAHRFPFNELVQEVGERVWPVEHCHPVVHLWDIRAEICGSSAHLVLLHVVSVLVLFIEWLKD